MLKLLSVLVLIFTFGIGQMWADYQVFTFNTDAGLTALNITKPDAGKGTSLGSSTYTLTPVSMSATTASGKTATRVYNSSGTTDLRIYQNGTFTFSISGSYKITSIVFAGTTVGGFSYSGSDGTWSSGTWTAGSGKSPTSVTLTATGTEKINTITVNYEAPCTKTLTIQKGTGTNCNFSLGTEGAQASCNTVSTTVTINPTAGYGTPVVSQEGASAAPNVTGSGNSQTVTYAANTTGTSTINVTCSANDYTITLNNQSATSAGTASITATYNSNKNLTSAIDKPERTGWVFGGYYTAVAGGGTQIIDAEGYIIAGVSTYTDENKKWIKAGGVTLYAKWTCTVTWSVTNLTNVYATQTVTYNPSGCKVSSVPALDPKDYCSNSNKFMGWSQHNAGAEYKTESYYDDLFLNVGESPDLKNIGSVTFYAVFADYAE